MSTTYESWLNKKVKSHGQPNLKLLDKKSRNNCFQTKKDYLNCVEQYRSEAIREKNFGKILKNCEPQIDQMFGHCPTSWVDHYIRGDMTRNFPGAADV